VLSTLSQWTFIIQLLMLIWDWFSMHFYALYFYIFLSLFFWSCSIIIITEKLTSSLNIDESLQLTSWCLFNFTFVRRKLKNFDRLISRCNHSVSHMISSSLMYFLMTWWSFSWRLMIFICILFIFFKFLYVQYIKLTWWAFFSFHLDSCWFIIESVISMFIHVIICMRDRSKNVSVTNHLRDFSFMFLNRLMILNVWIIFLCVSFAISQSHFISQSCYIDCDCFDLEVTLSDWYQFLINAATQVLYMSIMITHMRLELTCSCSIKRSLSVHVNLMANAFIFASQYAWWIYQRNRSLFLSRWIQIFFSQLMIKTDEIIIRLTNFNDMRCADELAFTHEHSIFNLLLKEHFASLDWDVLKVFSFRCSLNFFL